MFFTQQVKESSGGFRVLWAVHEWEEQGNRGWTEQQCWTGCLLIRIGLMTRDSYLLLVTCTCPQLVDQLFAPRHLLFCQHRHTDPVFNAPAPLHCLYKNKCSMHCCSPTKTTLLRAPELQEENGLLEQRPCHSQAFSALLSQRRMTHSRSVTLIMIPYITLVL